MNQPFFLRVLFVFQSKIFMQENFSFEPFLIPLGATGLHLPLHGGEPDLQGAAGEEQ